MSMTLLEMANELQAIIDGERPRLNKTEMREYVRDLRHLTQPAQSVDVEKIREVIAGLITNAGDLDRIDVCPMLATHLRNSADKLTAALQEKGNG